MFNKRTKSILTNYSDTYGAQITAEELRMSFENHKSLREDNTSMLLFGNGDGGGGPLATMVKFSFLFITSLTFK